MMDFYETLAPVYDGLNRDADYQKMADCVKSCLEDYLPNPPEILLDAGCGTGSLTLLLSEFAENIIGADASYDMLCVARNKAISEGKDILFLEQSLEELDLYGTVDGAVCTMDTLNHLPDFSAFSAALARIALFIAPGGLFLLDLNTAYKHRMVLGNSTIVKESEEAFCVWENSLEPDLSVSMTVNLFVGDEEMGYDRQTICQKEILIPEETLFSAAKEADLVLLERFADYDRKEKPTEETQRITYLFQKK